MWGKLTARVALAARTASMAVPPSRSTSCPVSVASVWGVQITPERELAFIPRLPGRMYPPAGVGVRRRTPLTWR